MNVHMDVNRRFSGLDRLWGTQAARAVRPWVWSWQGGHLRRSHELEP